MAELRKHRELSEIVFGLALKEQIDWNDIDENMLVYPYNAAADERKSNPEKANQAYLISKYGADAITAAKQSAEVVHNGIAPEEWIHQLSRVYQDFQIVNVMHKTRKKIEEDQEVDLEELKDVIDGRLSEQRTEPLSWADIKDEFDQEWLWPSWIPHGEVTILVGQQGAGKSAFALYFADCVANGKPLPDGSVLGQTHKVLWVETEGRFGENIRRARAWGVNPNNILIPSQDRRKIIDLTKVEDKALIRSHAVQEDVGLIVIDSLGGSLVDENDASAKRVLHGLSRMAQETNTTFLVIHHLRKPQKYAKGHQRITLADVRGHSGITQFAPSVIAIDYEGNEMPRFVHPLKMNLVEEPPTMTFTMGPMGLVWNESTHDQVRRQVVQETVHWLTDLLKQGPMPTKQVVEVAEAAGINKDILSQAIDFPQIKTIKNAIGEKCLSL